VKQRLTRAMIALGLAAAATAAGAQQHLFDNEVVLNRIIHRLYDRFGEAPAAGGTGQATPAITWHGGPVMGGAPNIHLIWYGDWNQANGSDNAGGQQIIRDLMWGLSGSNHLSINQSYSANGTPVSGVLGPVQEASVGYIAGNRAKRLRDSDILSIVTTYTNSHGGPQSNAIYFVLTSSDVNETSGFCTQYCGWHTKGTIAGTTVKYSFVGNANRCLNGCAAQSVGPNGNAGVDGMASVLTHELEEALTDPLLNAWYDANGAENADKCAWTFGGAQQVAGNGASYNVTLPTAGGGFRNYLLQRNLSATDSKCYVDGVTKQQ